MYALRLRNISLISVLLLWATPAASSERDDVAPSTVEVPEPNNSQAASKLTKAKPRIQPPAAVATPASAPAPVPARKAPIQRVDRSQRPSEHLVRKGDWLSKIAVRYGMSVQEVMDINGLADDSIDIGDTLRLRPAPVKAAAELAPTATSAAIFDPAPKAEIVEDNPDITSAAQVSNDIAGETVEEAAATLDKDAEGLTAAQLVGPLVVSGADDSQGVNEANVTIPTPVTASVNPLSRARLALAIALMVLGMLTIHPRSRSMLLDRIPGLNLGAARGREVLAAIEMQATRRVGSNQQVMLMEVSGTRLLVGVSDGRMDVLHRWDDSNLSPSAPEVASNLASVSGVKEEAAESHGPDITPTVRQQAIRDEQVPSTPTLTPSAEELLDTWRDSVREHPIQGEASSENVPWWMEGATSFERAVLSEDDVEEIRVDAPSAGNSDERERVQESILATLRDRRIAPESTVQASERGMHDRSANNSHGGFRAAARLGRKPRLGSKQQPSEAVSGGNGTEAAGSAPAGQRRARSASSMSFKL